MAKHSMGVQHFENRKMHVNFIYLKQKLKKIANVLRVSLMKCIHLSVWSLPIDYNSVKICIWYLGTKLQGYCVFTHSVSQHT
jgi:hypothetical protein